MGLKNDGTIVAWGDNSYCQCDVPSPNEDFIAVGGGYNHSMGLKSDGTIVAWGDNSYGQCNIPSPNEDFIAVAGAGSFSMGLRGPSTTAVVAPRPVDLPGPFAIRSVSPNPFNPSAEISFETSVSSPLIMEVFDVRGRRVGKLGLGSFEPGVHHVCWDGRDEEGAELASGMYFLRLRGATGESRAVKALLLR
jgi:hypothetical protein